ncbi:uncharacterized protein LOC142340378 [Convolutriloba macropyga]|uniref:uncharacterized protein LOC142340378 n=1 Tax=Convolutriloba macropyga TaxID=536237 RepID=UPI003F526B14
MQKALSTLESWANQFSMEISIEKTEAVVFSLDPRETGGKSKPPFQLCDTPVEYSKNPKILGIEFDPQCSFTKQAETPAKSLRGRLQILQCLEGKSWGPRASDLRRLYVSYVRPGSLYRIGTWGSFLTDTALSKLESCNSRASCIITGLLVETNVVYSRVEADLPTIKQVIEEEAAKTFSKYS